MSYYGPILGAPKDVNTVVGLAGNTAFMTATTNATIVGYQAGLALNTSGVDNTFVGYQAGAAITSGTGNVIIGSGAGKTSIGVVGNLIIGYQAGNVAVTNPITAIGYQAGLLHTNPSRSTYIGYQAGAATVSAGNNTYIGFQTGLTATSGSNTCVGALAGSGITSGGSNVCIGFNAGLVLNTGAGHTLIGTGAGAALNAGTSNCTAVGSSALAAATGSSNTAVGLNSQLLVSTGINNTSIGASSLNALLTGTRNVAIGQQCGTAYTGAESNNVLLGYNVTGTVGESNVMRLASGTGTGVGQVNTTVVHGLSGNTQNPTATNKVVTQDTSTARLGVTIASSTPAANLLPLYDANVNLSANNMMSGYATTATAAGTTTLTVGSAQMQYFTGTTTQTVVLPVTSTLALGHQFWITNNSTGVVTVQSSGANTIQAMVANTYLIVTCIATSGTGTASWKWSYQPTQSTSTMIGMTDASAAAAGYIGEVISSTLAIGSATALTTATAKTVTSISLTAGDWDVWGNIGFIAAAGTLPTILEGSISATDNTQATSPNGGAYFRGEIAYPATSTQICPVGTLRVNISSTTTYYLVATATFTVSTLTAYGAIFARRRR